MERIPDRDREGRTFATRGRRERTVAVADTLAGRSATPVGVAAGTLGERVFAGEATSNDSQEGERTHDAKNRARDVPASNHTRSKRLTSTF